MPNKCGSRLCPVRVLRSLGFVLNGPQRRDYIARTNPRKKYRARAQFEPDCRQHAQFSACRQRH